ncbi:MAG: HAD family hydrolase [Spirochaetota bacterium]
MGDYRGIVFDFNGTLVWDNPYHEEAWIRFAHTCGCPIDPASYYQDIHGNTTEQIFKKLLGHQVDPEMISRLSKEKEHMYREICLEHAADYVLAPGAVPLLTELKQLGVPMTIATASELDNLQFFIEYFQLERWFETDKIVYDDGTVPNKPQPDIYELAASKLGIQPEEMVVVEDSRTGIQAAQAAGCRYVIAAGESAQRLDVSSHMDNIAQSVSSLDEIDQSMFSFVQSG